MSNNAPDYKDDLVFPPHQPNKPLSSLYTFLSIIAGIITAGLCYAIVGWQMILVVIAFVIGFKLGWYVGDNEE